MSREVGAIQTHLWLPLAAVHLLQVVQGWLVELLLLLLEELSLELQLQQREWRFLRRYPLDNLKQ